MLRRALVVLLVSSGILLGYLSLWPVGGSAEPYVPPADPGMTGRFAPNELLRTAQQRTETGRGPEDIAKGPDGLLYAGLEDGRIVRFREDGGPVETFVNTNGRPLGMRFDRRGNLIVADAFRGVLSIHPDRTTALLTNSTGGERLLFPDGLDIAPDGIIWFSNASQKYDQRHWRKALVEPNASGSLLRLEPESGRTTVALSGLMFANGVAVGPNGDYVLVNETHAARITRFWIRGPNAGRSETFLVLPGYPDNLSFNGKDTFWVALPSPRNRLLEQIWPRPAWRKVLLRLPEVFLRTRPYSWIIGVGTDGKVIRNCQDSSGGAGMVTSVNEFDGRLYLGSITTSYVSRYTAP